MEKEKGDKMKKQEYLTAPEEKRFDALEDFLLKEYDTYIKASKVGLTLQDFFQKNKKELVNKFVSNLGE
jgi:hypothetical protein